MLIPLVEYAEIHGRNPATARQKALRGGFKTAVKMGRDWFIDSDEPYIKQKTGSKSNVRETSFGASSE